MFAEYRRLSLIAWLPPHRPGKALRFGEHFGAAGDEKLRYGDLFGTTSAGGAYGDGTVFEIAKTPTGYASTPTTLVSFNSSNGSEGSLIADANGDLFGTTVGGGASGDGEPNRPRAFGLGRGDEIDIADVGGEQRVERDRRHHRMPVRVDEALAPVRRNRRSRRPGRWAHRRPRPP